MPSVRQRWLFASLLAVAVFAFLQRSRIERWLNTASTSDAYVNGHYTMVAPRVAGQVKAVLVDDNTRVRKGDVLLELDPEPLRVIVAMKTAAVDVAAADLVAADVQVRTSIAMARGQRFKLQNAIEQVDNQIAIIKARVAAYKSREAVLADANANLARDKALFESMALARQEYDKTIADAKVAAADVAKSLQEVYEARVALGLPAKPDGTDLAMVPANLNQTHSSVRVALAEFVQALTAMGYPLPSWKKTPQEFIDAMHKVDDADTEVLLKQMLQTAPTVKTAAAKLEQARRDLAQAELNLSYCRVVAEIDGVITRRNVNPGNNVVAGQQVMVVRSLTDIWIDANFQETDLAKLAIGQAATLEVDMYGSKKLFEGRISGFTDGTGLTLSLLPPQNATGNFVKVTQRLPVRIDLIGYEPLGNDPLFAGLSVVPYVKIHDPPTGPDAGKKLQSLRDGR